MVSSPLIVISLQSLTHVVKHLPIPVVLTDDAGYVVGSSALADSVLDSSADQQHLHLEDHLLTIAGPRPTTDRATITSDVGPHELIVLGQPVVGQAAPADVAALAGEVAHDFNNLLGVIMNYASLAAASADEGSQQAKDLAEVLEASRRAADIADRLRRMSAAAGPQ
ncbi:MAG: hypothetical protein JHD16_10630 [Solirubrobacteraceae bacterium]|nr:hypothetical protein [Solirubrobacteraceae bacterium]